MGSFFLRTLKLRFDNQMTVKDCGQTRGCFRSCQTDPNCPTDEVDYIVTVDTVKSDSSIGTNEILFKMESKKRYILKKF